jgi:hypothetical protein
METSKLKEGKRVRYVARKNSGIGRVVEVYPRKNGDWVVLHDKQRNAAVTVRPSQISPL